MHLLCIADKHRQRIFWNSNVFFTASEEKLQPPKKNFKVLDLAVKRPFKRQNHTQTSKSNNTISTKMQSVMMFIIVLAAASTVFAQPSIESDNNNNIMYALGLIC